VLWCEGIFVVGWWWGGGGGGGGGRGGGGGGIKVGEKEVKEDRVMEGAQEYKEMTHYFQISPNNHR